MPYISIYKLQLFMLHDNCQCQRQESHFNDYSHS